MSAPAHVLACGRADNSWWVEVKAEEDANRAGFVAAMRRGEPADGAAARALAEDARQHISRRFYECSPKFHCCLADMYVNDERFRANFDELAPGLAQYVHDAIKANAAASDA